MTTVTAPPAYDEPYRAERPAFLWLLEREIVRFLKIWRFSIAGQILAALLFLLVFGVALTGHVAAVDGIPYERFILPGLVVQAVFTVGFVNGTTSLFEARNDRYIHGVLTSPLRWWEIDLALVLGGIVREVLVGTGVLVVGGIFVGVSVARPLVFVAAVAGVLVGAAQAGVIAGAYARSLDDVYSMESLVVLPLGFLSGVFYSVSQLPDAWRFVTYANPVFYDVDATRAGLLGSSDLRAGIALLAVYAVAAGLSVWSLLIFRSGKRLKP